MSRLRRLAAASLIAIAALHTAKPATAQWIVFDPNNYAQNVLNAARALQQINKQIGLHNEAQMLRNQAKNLACLPFAAEARAVNSGVSEIAGRSAAALI
jgi:P-type conjugative transfer protein TrbJ